MAHWGAVVALLGALVAVVAAKAGRAHQQDLEAALAAACDVGVGPCTAALADGAVDLELAPRPVRPSAPLTVTVTVRGGDPATGELRIRGVAMPM